MAFTYFWWIFAKHGPVIFEQTLPPGTKPSQEKNKTMGNEKCQEKTQITKTKKQLRTLALVGSYSANFLIIGKGWVPYTQQDLALKISQSICRFTRCSCHHFNYSRARRAGQS